MQTDAMMNKTDSNTIQGLEDDDAFLRYPKTDEDRAAFIKKFPNPWQAFLKSVLEHPDPKKFHSVRRFLKARVLVEDGVNDWLLNALSDPIRLRFSVGEDPSATKRPRPEDPSTEEDGPVPKQSNRLMSVLFAIDGISFEPIGYSNTTRTYNPNEEIIFVARTDVPKIYVYQKEVFLSWMRRSDTDPMTREPVEYYTIQTEPIVLKGHTNYVSEIAWSRDGTRFASGGHDNTVRIWETDSYQSLATLTGHTDNIEALSWSPDGTKLASGSFDNTIRIWNTNTYESLGVLRGHISYVWALDWSPDGTKLASGGMDDKVRIWDTDTSRSLSTLHFHMETVVGVAWSPDGTKLASCSGDGLICIWEANTEKLMAIMPNHVEEVSTVVWSHDGTKLASSGYDHTIRIWNTDTYQLMATIRTGTAVMHSLTWSPDDTTLASTGSKKIIRIWDMETYQSLTVYTGYVKNMEAMIWLSDEIRFASGANKNDVYIWKF